MTEQPREQCLPQLRSRDGEGTGAPDHAHGRHHRHAQNAPVSGARRHLLKAAASVGPVIATLPSGEAFAMASALQCVIKEQDGSQDQPQGVVAVADADNYIRVPGRREEWFSTKSTADGGAGVGIIEVYRFPDQDGNEVVIVGDNADTAVSPIAPVGTWFDTSTSYFVRGEDKLFLRMYYADPNPITGPSDVAVDVTGTDANGYYYPATGCAISNPSSAWPGPTASPPTLAGPEGAPAGPGTHCIYPLAVQADPTGPGNVPLTASCLLSFNS
ncbi:MAG: hypothetical protein LJE69_13380 [Thiohalocapsa sp.]|jgi:hypothetical protein|uniref:hypothetical protein n=1 Tax=Thiohalocapsa sp. TaxID=2497641 RepID=UPI0025F478CA|nr:hypothetical protein [Thiohalocapsa sp.]MCG6942230.1 hypothetical protein [Thiohalocapsa sp.]